MRHPLLWMIVGGLAMIVIEGIFIDRTGAAPVLAAGLAIGVYLLVMRVWAGRDTPELAPRIAPGELLRGLAIGVAIIGVSVLVLVGTGTYLFHRTAGAGWGQVWPILTATLVPAVVEELTSRGFLLQGIEVIGGSDVALFVSALVFGFLHAANHGASLWTSFAIFVEAGLLIGAGFLWRRNLWFGMGIHYGWNVLVALLGIPVSGGHAHPGLFTVTDSGPGVLNGGAFGIEGSAVLFVLGGGGAAVMYRLSRRGTDLSTWRDARADTLFR
jgi:membrane protease YdiL (CAAX protease family)